MFRHGEIAQVLNTAKDWTLDIGWSKSKQKYWISINGKKFDEMDAVPGKQGQDSVEEESKVTDRTNKALKLKLRTQKTLPTMCSSEAGDVDNEMSN